MTIKHLTILTVFLVLFSCENDKETNADDNNDDTVTISKTDLDLVTGLVCVNLAGGSLSHYGNPNTTTTVKLEVDTTSGITGGSHGHIALYPNPCKDICFISSAQTIDEVWVVKGKVTTKYQRTNFSSVSVDTTGLDELKCLHSKDLEAKQIALNLSDLDAGFYKLVIRTSLNELAFIPVYKAAKETSTEELLDFLDNIW